METLNQVIHTDVVPPGRLRPGVPRDLETICVKCLEKETHRRYATAADLADELSRFQAGRAIAARPVSSFERLWRWCRRNPLVAASIAAAIATLLVGSVLSTALAIRAIRAEKATRKEWTRAEAESAISKAVNEFLNKDLLAQAAPTGSSDSTRHLTLS